MLNRNIKRRDSAPRRFQKPELKTELRRAGGEYHPKAYIAEPAVWIDPEPGRAADVPMRREPRPATHHPENAPVRGIIGRLIVTPPPLCLTPLPDVATYLH